MHFCSINLSFIKFGLVKKQGGCYHRCIMHKHHNSRQGFTIVELLIVIVVIAILAAITMVAYTNFQQRATVSSIASEARQWRSLFEVYKATYGQYPAPATGNPMTSGGPGANALNRYCLGTGFPERGGTRFCGTAYETSSYRAAESTGSYLLSQLSEVGTPPINSKKYVFGDGGGGAVGPYLRYGGVSIVRIVTTFPPGIDCASLGMVADYGDSIRQDCYYPLDYS